MNNDIYDELFTNTIQFPLISLGSLFKIPLVIFLLGNLFYAYMLVLKVRVLVDTFDSNGNTKIKTLVYTNLIVSIAAAILGTVLILLG